MLHYSRTLEKYGMLFNCYVHERFHRVAKRYATDTKNPDKAMRGIIYEVTAHKLTSLIGTGAFNFDVGLVNPVAASRRKTALVKEVMGFVPRDLSVSITSRFSEFGTCDQHDFVLVAEDDGSFSVAQVKLHLNIDGNHATIIACWKLEAAFGGEGYSKWSNAGRADLISTHLIIDVVTYTLFDNGSIGVLVPCELR